MPHDRNSTAPGHPAWRGFTLVEVLISIAIAIVLLIGVVQVFSLTSATVGIGQAVSSESRDWRLAQTVMYNDLRNSSINDNPAMVLVSERRSAFANAADALSDATYDNTQTNFATVDQQVRTVPGWPGGLIPPSACNYRSHRTDTFSFFARGNFHRQTGNPASSSTYQTYQANMSSTDAWIWYGHVQLPNNALVPADTGGHFAQYPYNSTPTAGTFYALDPGLGPNSPSSSTWPSSSGSYTGKPLTTATNPNNFYTNQWVLGRYAMLLSQKTSGNSGNIVDSSSSQLPQKYINRIWTMSPSISALSASGGSATDLAPVAYGSVDTDSLFQAQDARYDVGWGSIEDMRQRLKYVIDQTYTAYPPPNDTWWKFMWTPTQTTPSCRCFCNPFPSKPLDQTGSSPVGPSGARQIAQTSPYLFGGCSQFVVEYTGDYLTQDGNGNVTAAQSDGVMDFIIVSTVSNKVGGGTLTNSIRKMRWYGLPRDSTGSGAIPGPTTNGSSGAGGATNAMSNVVPLNDLILEGLGKNKNPYTFEKILPATPTIYPVNYADPVNGLQYNDQYVCAWGPYDPLPKLVRFLFEVDDPNGRVTQSKWVEVGVELP